MQKHDWYSDTDPKALKVFIECQRALAPGQKLQSVIRLNRLLRRLAEASERKLHPQADDREIFLRVVARRLDRETMLRVYGWYPDSLREES
jgi:hypothetical protein